MHRSTRFIRLLTLILGILMTVAPTAANGSTVTFQVDWLQFEDERLFLDVPARFVIEMFTDVARLNGLDASRAVWDWNYLELEGSVIPGTDGTMIALDSAPAVSVAAWKMVDAETAESLYEIGHDQLWNLDAPLAFLSLLGDLEFVGIQLLSSDQQFLASGADGTAVRAAGGSLVTTIDEAGGLTESATELTLDDASSLTVGDRLRIDGEILRVAAVDANLVDISVVRGTEDTVAAAHDDGSRVYDVEPREDWFGSAITVTTADVDAVATTLPVRLGGEFADGDVIRLFEEDLVVSCPAGPCGNDLAVTRGARGTVAAAHPAGTHVKRFLPVADWTLDQLAVDEVQRGAGSIDFSLVLNIRTNFDLRKLSLMLQNISIDFREAGHLAVGDEIPVAFDQSIDVDLTPADAVNDLWTFTSRLWFDSETTFDATVALFNDPTRFDPIFLRQLLVGAPEFNGAVIQSRTATCRPHSSWTHQEKQCITTVPTARDLGVIVSDGATTAVPGESLTYTLVASNDGLANPSARVQDDFPAGLTCSWTSVAAGGATGNTDGSGNLDQTLDLPALSSVTYTITCAIDPAATGTLSNTATISSAEDDFDPANDSSTDADTVLAPAADLAITKTDSASEVVAGGTTTYTVVASNAGPSQATADVVDVFPAVTDCSWTSVAAGGASGHGNGSGELADTLTLPPGSSVTYTAVCVIDRSASGTLSNTATITSPVDVTAGNNAATDDSGIVQPPTAVIEVTGFGDVVATDGVCTLREALTNANANGETTGGDCTAGTGDDTVMLPAGVYSLTIAGTDDDGNLSGDLDVTDPFGLAILGGDTRTTILDGGALDRVIDVHGRAGLSLEGVTVRNGSVPPAPTTRSTTRNNVPRKALGDVGGGIRSSGSLELIEVRVSGNASPGDGGGLAVTGGTAAIRRSLFDDNQAHTAAGATGGGIAIGALAGEVTIEQTTLSGNTTEASAGGALSHAGDQPATLSYVTVTTNSSGVDLAGSGTLVLESSIVTGNGVDCSGGVTSDDYNVVGSGGDAAGCPLATNDLVASGAPGSVVDPLADNSGPTDTHGVFFGSPAIDRVPLSVKGCGTTQDVDQRGMPRPDSGSCEAGAYEGDAVPVELMRFAVE